jgi:hypothetical protein
VVADTLNSRGAACELHLIQSAVTAHRITMKVYCVVMDKTSMAGLKATERALESSGAQAERESS